MKKYKVLQGMHCQGGKDYSKGDIVISDVDLIALFPNKFELVGEVSAPKKASPPPAPVKPAAAPVEEEVEEEEEQEEEEAEEEEEVEETPKNRRGRRSR